MKRDLLIYQTIANRNDNVKLSFLVDAETGRYTFPSLTVVVNDKEVFYCDNDLYMIETLLPALRALETRDLNNDWSGIREVSESLKGYDFSFSTQVLSDMLPILEYAIEKKIIPCDK